MRRVGIIRFAVVTLSGIAVMVALAALVTSMRTGQPLGSGFLHDVGWLVPLVAGGAVGGLSWLMLSGTNSGGATCDRPGEVCPLCGSEVRGDWRMCPYCGGSLEPVVEAESSTHLA